MAGSVYKIIELVGTSTVSWEEAAKTAIEMAGQSLKDLRIAEITKLDMQIDETVKGAKRDEWRGNLPKENLIKQAIYNQLKSYQKETGRDIANEPPEPYGLENKVEFIFKVVREQKEY